MKIFYLTHANNFYFNRWYEYFIKHGHEVHVISGDDSLWDIESQLPEGVILHYLPEKKLKNKKLSFAYNFLRLPMIMKELKRLLREIKPDIIQAHQITPYGFWAALCGFRPFIMTPMGSDVLVHVKQIKLYGMITSYVLKKASIVTGDSITLNEASINFGAERKKVHLIQNGVDIRMFNENRDKMYLRNKLGLGNDPIILSTRTLNDLYNIDLVIKALPGILKKFPDAKLVLIYYSIENEESLKALVKELNIEKAVIFAGQIKYEDMPNYYVGADISVSVPSSDSSPCSVYESMASGTPVVISDLPWAKHFMKNGVNAIIVPLKNSDKIADAVIKVLGDKDFKKELRNNGIDTVKKYVDYETNMRMMEDLIFNLLRAS